MESVFKVKFQDVALKVDSKRFRTGIFGWGYWNFSEKFIYGVLPDKSADHRVKKKYVYI